MKVYPVVHINERATAVEQASKALDLGADGVYLIDHYAKDENLLFDTFNELDDERPDAYIGVNILQLKPLNAARSLARAIKRGSLHRAPDALWADNAGSAFGGVADVKRYRNNEKYLQTMRYLGGVAFKYTSTYTDDPMLAAIETRRLRHKVDVVTTSGKGTGRAPSIEKIRAMKEAAHGPLAVASGISIKNIADYRGVVDEVLVASSVETKPYSGIFDEQKLAEFLQLAHEQAE